MFRPGGYAVLSGPDGVQERDAFTCFHCQRVVTVEAKCDPMDLGGICGGCGKMICPTCVGKGCDPFEEKLKREEARYEFRRSLGF